MVASAHVRVQALGWRKPLLKQLMNVMCLMARGGRTLHAALLAAGRGLVVSLALYHLDG